MFLLVIIVSFTLANGQELSSYLPIARTTELICNKLVMDQFKFEPMNMPKSGIFNYTVKIECRKDD